MPENGREEARTIPRSAVVALVAAALGIFLSLVYFGRFAPAAAALRQVASPTAAALLVLLASFAAGEAGLRVGRSVFSRVASLPRGGSPASIDETVLVGVPLFGTLLGAIAWIGLPLEAAATLLALVGAGAGALLLWRRRPFGGASFSSWRIALLLPPVALAWAGAITPVGSPDELIYKLAVPRQYLLWGGMVELPLHSHSYFPAALSLSSIAALAISGGIAAKIVHFGLFLAALAAVARLARRLDPAASDWPVAVVAWTPALLLVAGWAWPDWTVLALLLVSYERWDRFRERATAEDAAGMTLALAAAAGCKYTALPWLCVFVPLAAWQLRRAPLPRARLAFAAGALLAVFGGFFYARNLVWTRSPVAPFLLPDSPQIGHFRSNAALGGWAGLFRGEDVLDPSIIDDSLGILLPLSALLSPFALFGAGRRYRDLFALGAVQFVGLVTFAPLSRLSVTALVPLALLGASICARAARDSPALLRGALRAAAAVALVGQILLVLYIQVVSFEFFPYIVGSETAERYLLRTQSWARTYAWISARTPPESRFLLLGEARTYYLERPAIAGGNLDGPRVARFLSRYPDPESFDRELHRLGVTHVLVNRAQYLVGLAAGRTAYDREVLLEVPPATGRMIAELLAARARPVFADGPYAVYALAR